jgi:hypothetical protein
MGFRARSESHARAGKPMLDFTLASPDESCASLQAASQNGHPAIIHRSWSSSANESVRAETGIVLRGAGSFSFPASQRALRFAAAVESSPSIASPTSDGADRAAVLRPELASSTGGSDCGGTWPKVSEGPPPRDEVAPPEPWHPPAMTISPIPANSVNRLHPCTIASPRTALGEPAHCEGSSLPRFVALFADRGKAGLRPGPTKFRRRQ